MFPSNDPSPDNQHTIRKEFSLEGIGIHSGDPCACTFRPANIDCGVFFSLKGEKIPAKVEYVTDTFRGTSLSGIRVVEHILAASTGLGIDNLEIELSGPEPPILDGSSLPYVLAFKKAGLLAQEKSRRSIIITRPLSVKEGKSSIKLLPFDGFMVHFVIDFPYIGRQECVFTEDFESNIAPARTFGLMDELEELKVRGLAKGASFENSLAIGQNGYLNAPRFPNEPARHKILDLIGDLALVGSPIKGEIIAVRSGHSLNIELARRVLNL